MQSILRVILIVVSILLLLVGFFIEDIAMVAISWLSESPWLYGCGSFTVTCSMTAEIKMYLTAFFNLLLCKLLQDGKNCLSFCNVMRM